ncbi:MAG: hypothetical protein AAFQ94_17480 [Bacteroidota bacterium]
MMIELIVDVFLWSLASYLVAGLVFATYFLVKGAPLIDEGTRDTPWHFKAIILPGVILLWVVLLMKLMKK